MFDGNSLKTSNGDIGNLLNGSSNCTMFLVAKNNNVDDSGSFLFDLGMNVSVQDDANNGCNVQFNSVNVIDRFVPSFYETDQVRTYLLDSISGYSSISTSGNMKTKNSDVTTISCVNSSLQIGSRINNTNSLIAEILIYGRALSDSELSIMNSYLCDKWGVLDLTVLNPIADEIASTYYVSDTVYPTNLATSSTVTASNSWHYPVTNLINATDAAWDSGGVSDPWIELEWVTTQTIKEIQIISYSGSSTLAKAAYSTTIDGYYWDGLIWIHFGKFEIYGKTLIMRFADAINTDKLKFVLGEGLAADNHNFREILCF